MSRDREPSRGMGSGATSGGNVEPNGHLSRSESTTARRTSRYRAGKLHTPRYRGGKSIERALAAGLVGLGLLWGGCGDDDAPPPPPRDADVATDGEVADGGVDAGDDTGMDAGAEDAGAEDAAAEDAAADAAGDDGGAMVADAGSDGGPTEELPTNLADVWMAEPGALDPPVRVRAAVVTFVRPAIGSEPAGFFLQNLPDGPAVFVTADLGLTPALRPGEILDFDVTEVADLGGMRVVTSVTEAPELPLRRSTLADVGALEREVSGVVGLGDEPEMFAGELVSAVVTVESFEGGVVDSFDVFGASTEASSSAALGFRAPFGVAAGLGLDGPRAAGCQVRVGPLPVWRVADEGSDRLFFTSYDPTGAFMTRRFEILSCPSPRLVSASLTPTELRLEFSRPLYEPSVTAGAFRLETSDGTPVECAAPTTGCVQFATYLADTPHVVFLTLTADALVPGESYVVRGLNLTDLSTGSFVVAPDDVASFEVPAP